MSEQSLVTLGEAASILGVSGVALRQWTDEGMIKAFITPGGHRRYSKGELKKFMSSYPKVLGVKDLVAKLEATSELHREIDRTFLMTGDWYSRLDAEAQVRLAHLGRSMLNTIVMYITEPAKREETLKLAREVGQGFGQTLAVLGLPLTDAVEAFILHRDPIMNATAHLMRKREAHSRGIVEAIPLVARAMDEALVALVATHQQYSSATPARKGDDPL